MQTIPLTPVAWINRLPFHDSTENRAPFGASFFWSG